MVAAGTPEGTSRAGGRSRVLVTLVGVVVGAVALVALGGQAVRGNRVVGAQLSARSVHDASVDDAFYQCLDTQAHSLVRPGQTVVLSTDNLADVITMIKGFGSWVTVADPPSRAQVTLTLHDGPAAPGTCLGTRVVATTVGPGGVRVVRLGTGAQVPGQGPPPAPPL